MKIFDWSPAQARYYDPGPKSYDPMEVEVRWNGQRLEGFISGERVNIKVKR